MYMAPGVTMPSQALLGFAEAATGKVLLRIADTIVASIAAISGSHFRCHMHLCCDRAVALVNDMSVRLGHCPAGRIGLVVVRADLQALQLLQVDWRAVSRSRVKNFLAHTP